jgi:ATP-binding cassette subfamily B protein
VGSHEELLDLKGLYYAMWRQQVGERRNPALEKPAAMRRLQVAN